MEKDNHAVTFAASDAPAFSASAFAASIHLCTAAGVSSGDGLIVVPFCPKWSPFCFRPIELSSYCQCRRRNFGSRCRAPRCATWKRRQVPAAPTITVTGIQVIGAHVDPRAAFTRIISHLAAFPSLLHTARIGRVPAVDPRQFQLHDTSHLMNGVRRRGRQFASRRRRGVV